MLKSECLILDCSIPKRRLSHTRVGMPSYLSSIAVSPEIPATEEPDLEEPAAVLTVKRNVLVWPTNAQRYSSLLCIGGCLFYGPVEPSDISACLETSSRPVTSDTVTIKQASDLLVVPYLVTLTLNSCFNMMHVRRTLFVLVQTMLGGRLEESWGFVAIALSFATLALCPFHMTLETWCRVGFAAILLQSASSALHAFVTVREETCINETDAGKIFCGEIFVMKQVPTLTGLEILLTPHVGYLLFRLTPTYLTIVSAVQLVRAIVVVYALCPISPLAGFNLALYVMFSLALLVTTIFSSCESGHIVAEKVNAILALKALRKGDRVVNHNISQLGMLRVRFVKHRSRPVDGL